MKPAKACIAVYINQDREAHNPGGPANTILVKNLDIHKDAIHELFSPRLTGYDEVTVTTSWSLGEHIFGGKEYIQFTFYCYYELRVLDKVDVESVIDEAITRISELKLGLTHHLTHQSDEISDEGILGPCKNCKGRGYLVSYSSYRGDVDYDCPECNGHGKKLAPEYECFRIKETIESSDITVD